MNLQGIGFETQIEDCLFGQSNEDKEAVKNKIANVTAKIDKVHKINGLVVYMPIVKDDDIWYYLQKPGESWINKITPETERPYYYPIQYANIEIL